MDTDGIFRLTLLSLLLVDWSMPAYFRRRAAVGIARPAERRLERRLLPELVLTIVAYAGILAYVLDPAALSWSRVPLPDEVQVLGIALAIVGLVVMCWAFRHLGHNLLASSRSDTEHTLITTGPYRWVRHPLYSAWALLFLGYGLITASWVAMSAAAAAFVAVARRTAGEESSLISRFGETYSEYAARTGRFFPHPKRQP
ncbi:MAG: isoprenylcysteine carboxylmethyltransferase family protein [Gemmatimonadales bacterium]|jgi:protein-S-isoprenylcysteine O-methyltransferase Ste14